LTATVRAFGMRIHVMVRHAVPYWRVFEFGATIHGKPLLWIPLSFATDAQGKNARDYPGRLFRVDRAGKAPLLMTRRRGQEAEAKYFGKESVTIPRKFRLREIIRGVAKMTPTIYRRAFRRARGNG